MWIQPAAMRGILMTMARLAPHAYTLGANAPAPVAHQRGTLGQ
jgi:hypothetical protein